MQRAPDWLIPLVLLGCLGYALVIAKRKGMPGWLAPWVGAFVGCFVGLEFANEPGFPLTRIQASLGGLGFGLLGGLLLWAHELWHSRGTETPAKPAKPVPPPPFLSTRWFGLALFCAGLTCLGVNHAMAVFYDMKWMALGIPGPIFASVGLVTLIEPRWLTSGMTGAQVSPWVHVVAIALLVGGIALGLHLWFVVYQGCVTVA